MGKYVKECPSLFFKQYACHKTSLKAYWEIRWANLAYIGILSHPWIFPHKNGNNIRLVPKIRIYRDRLVCLPWSCRWWTIWLCHNEKIHRYVTSNNPLALFSPPYMTGNLTIILQSLVWKRVLAQKMLTKMMIWNICWEKVTRITS